MGAPIRGIIEGFYGTPWTWDQRIDVGRHVAALGMTHYVYAPKDDPKHRAEWRQPYGAAALAGFTRMVEDSGLLVGFAISPGLDIDFGAVGDRKALFAKVDQVVAVGVPLVVLALDDIDFDPSAGPVHAALTADLAEHLAGRADVALVPTEYVGTASTEYLDALGRLVPAGIDIGWTGPEVVSDAISADQARDRAAALGGRPPLLWDNYPVNDGLMADRLFLGPLWGRDAALRDACAGYLANVMVQPQASKLPLASAAAWVRGDDPLAGWVEAAGDLRVFAEACDGAVPQALAASLAGLLDGPEWAEAVRPVAPWLAEAAGCRAPGLEGEADEWLAQVHREARLTQAALQLVQLAHPHVVVDQDGRGRVVPPDPDAAFHEVFNVAARWPGVRRATHTVMGARCSFRPVLAQRADGRWRIDRRSIQDDANATDAIVRAALAVVDHLPEGPGPVTVTVDGEMVAVADDGTFTVAPGAEVVSACGDRRTTQRTPCGPPLG